MKRFFDRIDCMDERSVNTVILPNDLTLYELSITKQSPYRYGCLSF
jgi:hypothetical protein